MKVLGSARFTATPRDWDRLLLDRELKFEPNDSTDGDFLREFQRASPWFAKSFAGITENGVNITRTELRRTASSVTSFGLLSAATSGSTGTPLRVHYSHEEYRFKYLLMLRPFREYGVAKDARHVIFVDSPTGIREPSLFWESEYYRVFGVLIGRDVAFSEVQKIFTTFKPHVIRGLPSAIGAFGRNSTSKVWRGDLRVVSPSGEFIDDSTREDLEALFDVKVLDRYGATECGAIAWQCPYCDRYHYNADELKLDTDDSGQLRVSTRFLTVMPLFRYELGDEVKLFEGSAGCRISLPTLSISRGRSDDFLIDGNGVAVPGTFFEFEKFDFILAWRVIQIENGDIHVFLETDTGTNSIHLDQCKRHVLRVVPGRSVSLRHLQEFAAKGKSKRVRRDFNP